MAFLLICIIGPGACLVEIRDLRRSGAATSGASAGGSSTGATSAGGGTAAGPCPADMVHVTDPEVAATDFCIDRTEVTQKQYGAFLVAVGNDVAETDQPTQCASNDLLQQSGAYCPDSRPAPNEPVNCVDWCDAWAYCNHVGKRLCGAIGGGDLASDDPGSSDEWELACSNGSRRAYPYGDTAELCTCYFPRSWEEEDPNGLCGNDSLENFNAHAEVGSHPDCEGGFPGLFDMTGNIAEWTNRCDSEAPDAACVARGGFTFGGYAYDDCYQRSRTWPRIEDAPGGNFDVGIRCCADVE